MSSDWIEAAAKEIVFSKYTQQSAARLDLDIERVSDIIRRHAPPLPGTERQPVQEAVAVGGYATGGNACSLHASRVDIDELEREIEDCKPFEVHIQWQRLANLLAEVRENRKLLELYRELPKLHGECVGQLAASQEREKRLREMLKQVFPYIRVECPFHAEAAALVKE